jgi:hypothetical protein
MWLARKDRCVTQPGTTLLRATFPNKRIFGYESAIGVRLPKRFGHGRFKFAQRNPPLLPPSVPLVRSGFTRFGLANFVIGNEVLPVFIPITTDWPNEYSR